MTPARTLPPTQPHPAPALHAPRVETCPPRRGSLPPGWWQRLRNWFHAGWPGAAPASQPLRRLERARRDFLAAIEDIETDAADPLCDRIHFARSLRELWHLRSELFSVVARSHDQHEAAERLAELNRHFPTRSARSGFAPLEQRDAKRMWP